MSELYEKLAAEREKSRPSSQQRYNENSVFTQLLAVAFENEQNCDELPEVFYISNVMFTKSQLEALLKRLEISANVKLYSTNYALGNTFRVELN